jgi:hypothetical protein
VFALRGLLDRNWPRGAFGDRMRAVMCWAVHKLRLVLARLRVLLAALIGWLEMNAIRLAIASPAAETAAS